MHKLLTILVSLALCVSANASPLPDSPHIYVEGSAEIEVEPDLATFTVQLDHVSQDAKAAKEVVDKKSINLIALCKKLGINPSDIASSGLRVQKKYEYDERLRKNVQVGVIVSRTIDIVLRNIKHYKKVSNALVASKIFDDLSTLLSLSDPKTSTDKALLSALEGATERAKSIAKLQGVELGDIHSVSEFNLRQPEKYQLVVTRKIKGQSSSVVNEMSATESSQRAADPFEPGVMKATAQVFVVFLIE